MNLPTRTFSADVGQASTGTAGPDAIEATFDAIIAFLTTLKSGVTDGDSGADNVAITAISGVTGSTVQAAIEDLKTQINTITQGGVADGSITNIKLADSAVTSSKLSATAIADKLGYSPGRVARGSYTGDGTENRQINVGFQPKVVWINTTSNASGNSHGAIIDSTGGYKLTASPTGSNSLYENPTSSAGLALNSNGFTVSGSSYGNTNTVVYRWIAWA